MKAARRFLEEGHKVKFVVQFKGRENAHTELGREMLTAISELLRDVGTLEQTPRLEGRNMSMMVVQRTDHARTTPRPPREVAPDAAPAESGNLPAAATAALAAASANAAPTTPTPAPANPATPEADPTAVPATPTAPAATAPASMATPLAAPPTDTAAAPVASSQPAPAAATPESAATPLAAPPTDTAATPDASAATPAVVSPAEATPPAKPARRRASARSGETHSLAPAQGRVQTAPTTQGECNPPLRPK